MTRLRKFAVVVVAGALIWVALPSIENKLSLGSKDVKTELQAKTALDSHQNEEENLEKISTPVYFSIFKFITGFLPGRN